MNIIYKIISNFINNKSLYIGEKVTMSDHMIQSAMIAERKKSSKSLICACLLHDYGHFILEDPNELVEKKLDGKHEEIGYEYLSKFFNEDVVGPIKYHVKAKRYLARSKKYYNQLSDASKISLELQGGILNKKESKNFEKNKFFKDTVKLRKFDELAKKTNIKMKSINQYENLLLSQLL